MSNYWKEIEELLQGIIENKSIYVKDMK